MNKRLSESVKFISSAMPAAFTGAGTTVNGRGIRLNDAGKTLFRFRLGNVADTDLGYTFSVLEATDAGVTGARNIGNAVATPNFVLTTDAAGCIPDANVVQLTMNGAAAADVIVINGVTITARAAATSLANNEYDQRGNDAADAVELCAVINNALPDLVATDNGAGVITIQSRIPGSETITVTGITAVARVIPVTVEVTGIIEVDASALSDGYEYVFPRGLTGGVAAASTLSINAIVGNSRYGAVEQQISDSAFAPDN
jgi:hypothetical protein